MSKSLYLFTFLLFSFSAAVAQKTDYELVAETVNYYLDGGTNNDFEILKKAFHESATMKYIGKEYTEVNALEFFESRMKPGPKSERKTRIADISIAGHAASARLEIDYPDFSFIDFMNLLKIDGEWKIVNKIFYKKMNHKE